MGGLGAREIQVSLKEVPAVLLGMREEGIEMFLT